MVETTGTGKWRAAGVPHRGWTCIDVNDLGEPTHTCEMCEVMVVRYVHTMTHPDYPDTLDCGCICAGNMEQNVIGAQRRETALKSQQARRKRWLSRQWRISQSGNDYLNVDGFNIVVFPRDNHWAARVENRLTGETRFSQRHYPSEDAAKLASLTAMIAMQREHHG